MKFSLLFTLLLVLLQLVVSTPLVASTTESETVITNNEITDISIQYTPTTSKRSFTWYLQAADSSVILETISSIFATEVGDGTMKIVENKANNALFIKFNFEEENLEDEYRIHQQCVDLLKNLDRKSPQILIEVMIAEITWRENDNRGFNWKYETFNSDGRLDMNSSTQIDNGLLQNSSAVNEEILKMNGFKTSLSKDDRLKVFIHGLIDNNRLQIVSTPKIITTDNQEATISIKETTPIQTGFTEDDGNRSFKYQDFEALMQLTVTPRVGRGEMITLDVTQQMDELDQDRVRLLVFKTNRLLKTTLCLRNNQTAVLGGFITEKKNTTTNKTPFASNIPFLKDIIGRREHNNTKQELIMFITPHILFTELDGRRATQVVKENLTFTDNLDAALKERWKLVPDLPENEKILISKSTDGWHSTGRNTTIVDVIKTVPQNYPIHKIFPLNLLEKTDPDFTPMGYGRIHIPGILFNTIIKPDTEHAFYREFEITDAAEVKELQLFVASDNACITYINDQLVDFDPHMRTESGHDFEYWNRDIRITNNQLLKNGKNRILVMLKNEKNSNEAFFDCELRAHLKNGNGKLSTKAAQSISPKLGITQKMNPEQTKMTSDERIKELAKKWLK